MNREDVKGRDDSETRQQSDLVIRGGGVKTKGFELQPKWGHFITKIQSN